MRPEPVGPRLADSLAILVLAALLAAELHVAWACSITYDEFVTIGASIADATHREVVFLPGHPPLARVMVGFALEAAGVREGPASAAMYEKSVREPLLQWGYGEVALTQDNASFKFPFAAPGLDSIVVAARLPMVVFPVILAALAYAWSSSRFGRAGGLLTLGLVVTYQDLLGNAPLVKFDVPFATCALATAFAFDRLAQRGGWGALVAAGLAAGGALASKLSAPVFLAAVGAVAAVLVVRPSDPAPASVAHPFGAGTLGARLRASGLGAIVFLLLALSVLWLAYLGANPISAYAKGLFGYSPTIEAERGRALASTGLEGARAWLYFPRVFLMKMPLGALALLALAAFAALRPSGRTALASELLLLLPPLAIFAATVALAAPFGSRYLLPVVPFALVSAGRVAPWAGRSLGRWALALAPLACCLVGAAGDHPYHATATNLLAGPPLLAHRRLNNANVDWGGGLKALAAWQRARGIPYLDVVPFSSEPFQLLPRPDGVLALAVSSCPRMGNLAAYGVRGEVRLPWVLTAPEAGHVYAVSAHVLNQAWSFTEATSGRDFRPGERPPPIVLGVSRLPDELVGGCFVIFDERPRR
jgi:hypothetical protein